MKSLPILVLLLTIVLNVGCSKQEPVPPEPDPTPTVAKVTYPIVLGGVELCGDAAEAEAYLSESAQPKRRDDRNSWPPTDPIDLGVTREVIGYDQSPVDETTVDGVAPDNVSLYTYDGKVQEVSLSYHDAVQLVALRLEGTLESLYGQGKQIKVSSTERKVRWFDGVKRTELYVIGSFEVDLTFTCMPVEKKEEEALEKAIAEKHKDVF